MAGTSYTRQSSMSDGDTITAALFNNEFNQLLNAFSYASSGTTGHQHDGGAGEGGNIEIIGDGDFLNKIVVDSTNNRWGFFVEVSSSAVEQIRIQDGAIVPVTDNDIDLGTSSLEFIVLIQMHHMQLMVYTQTIDRQEGDNKWLKAILDKVRS